MRGAAARRDAIADELLVQHIGAVVANGMAPADAEALVGRPVLYDSLAARGPTLADAAALQPDPDVPDASATIDGAVRTFYWPRSTTTFPPRLVGVAWTAEGTPVALHAVLVRGAGVSRARGPRRP